MFNKSLICIISLLLCGMCLATGDLVIAGKGADNFCIILPDSSVADRFLWRTADQMQRVICGSTGTRMKIIREKEAGGVRHGIYLGGTRKALALGLDPEHLEHWQYRFKSDGQNIYIVGREKSKGNWQLRDFRYYELGSCKGAVDFLSRYFGYRVLQSGSNPFNGEEKLSEDLVYYDRLSSVSVKCGLDFTSRVQFKYCIGRELSFFYRLANNMFFASWMHSYGGHSHDKAIPKSLFDTHPEYFALRNGKRVLEKRPMYCLSNLQVQELIYKEMVSRLCHVDWVQLAQTDGFSPCECDACKNLYGVESWSEKLWILHRKLSERLYREMPSKRVVILSYADTKNVPKTFKTFPPNVMIELCGDDEDYLRSWSGCRTSGLVEYIYNWGFYHTVGLTPKIGVNSIMSQIRRFRRYGIQGIYTCGFGELWGLEGPAYYVFGQALGGRDDGLELLREYCRMGFGPASKEALAFYSRLYDGTRIQLPEVKYDYNKIDFRMPYGYDNYRILAKRYPESYLLELSGLLRSLKRRIADTGAGGSTEKLCEQMETEWNYLKNTVAFARSFLHYLEQPGLERLIALQESIALRDSWLEALVRKPAMKWKNRYEYYCTSGNLKLFGGYGTSLVRSNGNWCGRFFYPLVWNIPQLLKWNAAPGGRCITAMRDSGMADYQQLIPADFAFQKCRSRTGVRVSYDDADLQVEFMFRQASREEIANERVFFAVKVSPEQSERLFEITPVNQKVQCRLAKTGNPYNGIDYEDAELPDGVRTEVRNKGDGTVVRLSVPLKALALPPRMGRTCEVGFWHHNLRQEDRGCVWNPDIVYLNIPQTTYSGRGRLEFR